MNEQGCKWCNQKKDGGIDILNAGINLGRIGKLNIPVNLYVYDGKADIFVAADLDNGCSQYDGVLREEHIEIAYCPFCGRKLKEFF